MEIIKTTTKKEIVVEHKMISNRMQINSYRGKTTGFKY
jgi:hypothetical protein